MLCRSCSAIPSRASAMCSASSSRCSGRSRSSPGFPCLLLFAYQGYSSAATLGSQPIFRLPSALAGRVPSGSRFFPILGLALSSWVKWRVVATGIIFAAVFVPAGVWSHRERGPAHQVGISAQHSCHDVDSLAAAAGCRRPIFSQILTAQRWPSRPCFAGLLCLLCAPCSTRASARARWSADE